MPEQANNETVITLMRNGTPHPLIVRVKDSARSRNFRLWLQDKNHAVLSKPKRASKRAAMEFLNSNIGWLENRIIAAGECASLRERLKTHPHIYVGGRKWKVWIVNARRDPFFVEDSNAGELVLACPEESTDEVFEKLFIDFARGKILEKAEEVSAETGLEFGKVSVRDQASRWASRSSSGTLSFNWRILLLPPELQDYVVRHEFAHSRFMDHSVSFWIFLNRICPGAKRLDARLLKEGAEIFRVARK